MNRFLTYLVYSNTWLSVVSFLLAFKVYGKYLPHNSLYVSICIGIGVFLMYTFHRYLKIKLHYPSKRADKWLLQHFQIMRIQGIVFGSVFIFALLHCWEQIKSFAPALLIGLFISLAYLLPNKKYNLRNIPFLKAIWVSLTWTLVFFYLPKMETTSFLSFQFLPPFLMFYALTIPFDVRDQWLDEQKLKTLPQFIGKMNALYLGNIIMLIATFGLYFFWTQNLGVFLVSLAYLYLSLQKKIYANEIPLHLSFDGLLILLALMFNG